MLSLRTRFYFMFVLIPFMQCPGVQMQTQSYTNLMNESLSVGAISQSK